MTRKLLLSINPRHAAKILKGQKSFEFRKKRCREKVDSIIIYSTAPEKRVVGEVTIEDIIVGDIHEVWRLARRGAGISHRFYLDYYQGSKVAVAYKLGAIKAYAKPRPLSAFGISRPPRSFVYWPQAIAPNG
ncbi:MAG: hypothetical protein LBF38_02850 [Deltaproteobacteria bacterium]|nr:hypothetical protein [Deltaproteobacteria bacterium]